MTNENIKSILINKGVTHLYHANSVATASTFLKNGGLLSRGYVEDHGLVQTSQETDEKDKQVDVFYDIFFDLVDIHERSKGLNHYGPVVFVYSIDVIDILPEGHLKITKDNPIRWDPNMKENEKYFLSEIGLKFCFQKGKFAQHITVRHQIEPLSFEHLEKIIIDNPAIDDTRYFEEAYCHLQDLLKKYAIGASLEVRHCSPDCACQTQYRAHKTGYTYHKFHFK